MNVLVESSIVKVALEEHHNDTGKVAVGLVRAYGIRAGAVVLFIVHASHNIITVGTNDSDMGLFDVIQFKFISIEVQGNQLE